MRTHGRSAADRYCCLPLLLTWNNPIFPFPGGTPSMLSRRQFLQSVAALGAASTFFWRGDVLYARAKETRASAVVAAIAGGTLDPESVPKFMTPLLIPPVMPKAGTIKQKGGKSVDYYEISMKQISQQILPAGLPKTTVWGYGGIAAQSNRGLLIHNAPSL